MSWFDDLASVALTNSQLLVISSAIQSRLNSMTDADRAVGPNEEETLLSALCVIRSALN